MQTLLESMTDLDRFPAAREWLLRHRTDDEAAMRNFTCPPLAAASNRVANVFSHKGFPPIDRAPGRSRHAGRRVVAPATIAAMMALALP